MDHGKRQEEWNHTGDLAYAIAIANRNSAINQNTFNRYRQMHKSGAPIRTIKPSELTELG